MVNRKFIIQQLNNIQGEVNKVMLTEGKGAIAKWFSNLLIAVKRGNSTGKLVSGYEQANAAARGMIATLSKTPASKMSNFAEINRLKGVIATNYSHIEKAKQLGITVKVTEFLGPVAAWFGIKTVYNSGYNEGNSDEKAFQAAMGMPSKLPDSKSVVDMAKGDKPIDSKQKSLLTKIWNFAVDKYNKVIETVRDGIQTSVDAIGSIPFLVLSFSTALMMMFAGVVIYAINVKGEILASMQKVFMNAIDNIKRSSGFEQMMRIVMAPISIVIGFIEESPLGSLVFMSGVTIFLMVTALVIIGRDIISGENKNKEASADKPADKSNSKQQIASAKNTISNKTSQQSANK